MERILLWEKNPPCFDTTVNQEEPCLLPFPVEGAKSAVLVLPGGGYCWRAEDHEGVKIAEAFNAHGITAFILRYRFAPYRYPVPMLDAARAVRTVRALAGKYGYAPDHIGILGFSAGGHLASVITTAAPDEYRETGDAIDALSCRPDVGLLGYAVLDFNGKYAHLGSVEALLGPLDNPEARTLAEKLSAPNRVTKSTPPCFLWHTAGDRGVPVENALLFASALSAGKVPFELHVYPYGDHGLGLANEGVMPHVSSWMELCVKFIRLHFGEQTHE